MAKVIRTATVKKPRAKRSFKVGEQVKWTTEEIVRGAWEEFKHKGEIIKVNPTTVHCIDKDGNVWSVGKKEAYAM